MVEDRKVYPDCINASNPYHECSDYCFVKIADAKALRKKKEESDVTQVIGYYRHVKDSHDDGHDPEDAADDNEPEQPAEEEVIPDFSNLTRKQKRLFELRLKMVELSVKDTTRRLEQQLVEAKSATINVDEISKLIHEQINKSYEEQTTQMINVVESRLTDTTTRLEQQLEVAMLKAAGRAQGRSKREISELLQQNNRSYEEQIAQRIDMHFAEAQAAMLKADERDEGYYKGETSELIQRIRKSHEEQMKQRLEEVESRVKDVTTRLEQQLTEAVAARLKADERAQEALKNSNKQIQMTNWMLWVQSVMFMIILACLLQSKMI